MLAERQHARLIAIPQIAIPRAGRYLTHDTQARWSRPVVPSTEGIFSLRRSYAGLRKVLQAEFSSAVFGPPCIVSDRGVLHQQKVLAFRLWVDCFGCRWILGFLRQCDCYNLADIVSSLSARNNRWIGAKTMYGLCQGYGKSCRDGDTKKSRNCQQNNSTPFKGFNLPSKELWHPQRFYGIAH